MKIVIVLLSVLILAGCSDPIIVSWEQDDVIDNSIFQEQYSQCTERYNGNRITGKQFEHCLIDSYNLALEK